MSNVSGVRRWNIAETRCVSKRKTEAGDKFVNNYRVLQTLGQGRFGKVKLCERLAAGQAATGRNGDAVVSLPTPAFAPPKARLFAMKIFSKKTLRRLKDYCAEPAGDKADGAAEVDAEDGVTMRMRAVTALDRVHDEIEIMRSLYHRNIVLLFEVIEADDSDKLYMVLEHMTRGPCMVYRPDTKDFYSRVTGGTLPEELARSYLTDILLGLQYLHRRRICHRDIKPDNVLLNDSGRCHLTDFGFLGARVLLRLPFTSENTRELFDEIIRAEIVLPGPDESGREQPLSPEARDLLHRLLEKDPEQRITIDEAISHSWFIQDGDDDEPLSF
ncbi:hypothetical protein PF002_g5494 [Phytophthora fragariae]|uniref:Protein kinase domain-containing protein n=1 Tax=Phytophthora fragariae TaxID=53985 RepID=A0A6A3FKR9_9STRA|nr:hypothetical protein PF009_g5024 [Phytophthora fragariae]KAE9024181.1 hypothetical protein PF011_g3610 [Phytophthora fragariae]KAE9129827.1 hypothetical protein PF007_g4735 [Phytophthora fragariae]KAE9249022.1 hypothetical protein PF002_g5494 [Phytophthora fragariae]